MANPAKASQDAGNPSVPAHFTVPPFVPRSVYQSMEADEDSPLHRLWRLRSLLDTLQSALESEDSLDTIKLKSFADVAKMAKSEASEIGSGLEHWLDKDA